MIKIPTTIREAALPYALFLIGTWFGQQVWVMNLIGTPIHEMGHVIAAFATGGYGAWDVGVWNQAVIYGSNMDIVLPAGVYAEVIVGAAMAIVFLMFRRWTFLGGVLWFNAHGAGYLSQYQKDWRRMPDDVAAVATQTLDILMPMMWVFVVLAFALSIAVTIVKMQNEQGKIQNTGIACS